MKPDELHPTRSGQGDDDGCSAYQPSRSRKPRSNAGGFPQDTNERRRLPRLRGEDERERLNRLRRERYHRETTRREAAGLPRSHHAQHPCVDCGTPITRSANRCRPCYLAHGQGPRQSYTPADLTAQLTQPYRRRNSRTGEEHPSPTHERNVARLEQLRLDLPL